VRRPAPPRATREVARNLAHLVRIATPEEGRDSSRPPRLRGTRAFRIVAALADNPSKRTRPATARGHGTRSAVPLTPSCPKDRAAIGAPGAARHPIAASSTRRVATRSAAPEESVFMHVDPEGTTNQRGVALVVTLLVLVFLSLLASALLVSINVETKVAARGTRADQALNLAEAGIAEASERIRKGDIGTTGDPESVWQIFLTPAGATPVVSGDTVAVPTWQDPSSWLKYSTPGKGPDVLTVRYKTDAKQKVIYRYDPTKNPAIQTLSGQPIFVINSTGLVGDTKRTLVSEVIVEDVVTNVKGAATGAKMVQIVKDAYMCGYNHRVDTPTWTNVPKGRNGGTNSCNEDLASQKWEIGPAANDITGAWSEGVIVNDKKGDQYGSPAKYQANQIGFYGGAWEVFAMTQAEFYTMIGTSIKSPAPLVGNVDGLRYYDADGNPKTNGGTVEVRNAEGEGFMYVEGDIQFKSDFVYRGLIYSTGRITIDGRAWILGGVICKDKLILRGPDDEVVILFSHDAIAQGIVQNAGRMLTLSWREMP
jgi:type II secretory pathway pseudopilin PulG